MEVCYTLGMSGGTPTLLDLGCVEGLCQLRWAKKLFMATSSAVKVNSSVMRMSESLEYHFPKSPKPDGIGQCARYIAPEMGYKTQEVGDVGGSAPL